MISIRLITVCSTTSPIMRIEAFVSALTCFSTVVSATASTFPAFFYSHRLVSGLRPSLPHSEQLPFTLGEASTVVKRALEQCTSDAYILVNLPGLRVEDFQSFEGFENARKYMSQASTIVTFPHVVVQEGETTFDFLELERLLRIHCNTLTYTVTKGDHKEVPQYIDARRRLINIQLSPLNDKMSAAERTELLEEYDDLLKKILRKLPTPFVSVLYTTNTTREYDANEYAGETIYKFEDLPDDPRTISSADREAIKSSKTMIFPDITVFDKSRYIEFERNYKGERRPLGSSGEDHPDGAWAKDLEVNGGKAVDDTWLPKKVKKIEKPKSWYRFSEDDKSTPVVFDREFVVENAPMIVGGFVLVVVLLFVDVLKGFVLGLRKLIGGKSKQKSE